MRLLDNVGKATPDELKLAVIMGHIPGWRAFRLFGRNDIVGAGTYDVWPPGTPRVLPTSAGVATLASTSAADAAAGTGVRVVNLEGLDANYNEVVVPVTLNGLTPVVTAQTFIRINRMASTTVGSGGTNAGSISATVGGNLQCVFAAGYGESHNGMYTVPANHFLLFDQYQIMVRAGNNANLQVSAQARLHNGTGYDSWRKGSTLPMENGQFDGAGATYAPGKTDVRVQVIGAANQLSQVSIIAAGYLVDSRFA